MRIGHLVALSPRMLTHIVDVLELGRALWPNHLPRVTVELRMNSRLNYCGASVAFLVLVGCAEDEPSWRFGNRDAGNDAAVDGTEPPNGDASVDGTGSGVTSKPDSDTSEVGFSSDLPSTHLDAAVASSSPSPSSFGTTELSSAYTSESTSTNATAITDAGAPTGESTSEVVTLVDASTSETYSSSSVPDASVSDGDSLSSDSASTQSWAVTLSNDTSATSEGDTQPVQYAECDAECSPACFPTCIGELLEACAPTGTCSADGETSCWNNGVRSERTVNGQDYVRRFFNASGVECFSTERDFVSFDEESFIWRNGLGETVATGEFDPETYAVMVTCNEDGSLWQFYPPEESIDGCAALEVSGWSDNNCDVGSCSAGDAGL